MTARLARLALGLYPLAYRRRYGDEMRALLEDRPPRVFTVFDLARGALVAHLRGADAPADAVGPADRVRLSASGMLMGWVLFAAAGVGFYKSTEDAAYSAAGRTHVLLGDTHLAVQAVALIASATVVLGALPLIVAAVGHARSDPRVRRKLALAVLPLIVFAGVTGAIVAVVHSEGPHHSAGGYGAAVLWGIAGLVCGVSCVLACRAVLFAVPVRPTRLRAALACGTALTLAMFAITGATALYAIGLNLDAPDLAGAANGPFQLLSTTASVILQLIVMLSASALAAIATRRGWRAATRLDGSR